MHAYVSLCALNVSINTHVRDCVQKQVSMDRHTHIRTVRGYGNFGNSGIFSWGHSYSLPKNDNVKHNGISKQSLVLLLTWLILQMRKLRPRKLTVWFLMSPVTQWVPESSKSACPPSLPPCCVNKHKLQSGGLHSLHQQIRLLYDQCKISTLNDYRLSSS